MPPAPRHAWYCHHCAAEKTVAELRQVERDETCLYACRACGTEEGTALVPLAMPVAPGRSRLTYTVALRDGTPIGQYVTLGAAQQAAADYAVAHGIDTIVRMQPRAPEED